MSHDIGNFIPIRYSRFLLNLIASFEIELCFLFTKNNKGSKKPVNHFLQNHASAWYMVSVDSYCEETLPKSME